MLDKLINYYKNAHPSVKGSIAGFALAIIVLIISLLL